MTLQAGPFAFAILAMVLPGCTTPEPQEPPKAPAAFEDPLVPATPEENTDRIRSHSVSSYGAARGGAALRSPEDAYVLWNRHMGEDVKVSASAVNRDAAKDPVEEIVRKNRNSKEVAKVKTNIRKDGASKDRSVYGKKNAKDKSVYQKPAKKTTPADKTK